MHYWSSGSNTVEFYLEQSVSNLEAGNYKFAISIMGGDSGEYTCYAYAKINGEVVNTANMQITSYGVWSTGLIENIKINAGDTLVVGIYVKCAGAGNGAWGKIDDGLLNSMN